MATVACKLYYVDGSALEEGTISCGSQPISAFACEIAAIAGSSSDLTTNLQVLLSLYQEVTVCKTGSSCLAKIRQINSISRAELLPALVFVDIPSIHHDAQQSQKSDPERLRNPSDTRLDEAFCGLPLLEHIANESASSKLSKLVVPFAVVSDARIDPIQLEMNEVTRCLGAGAADVYKSPLTRDRIAGLTVHACRALKQAGIERSKFIAIKRERQLSWVGVQEEKPHAYLREEMVSGLMDGICKPEQNRVLVESGLPAISPERLRQVTEVVGLWHFNAHDFSEDELTHAGFCIFSHALTLPGVEKWLITADEITTFVNACRKAYNDFVPYHNFRHVIDVLQAAFHFLLRLNVLPPYHGQTYPAAQAKLSQVLEPFDALALLITAIGHDVGHPGVNNAFLVALNAPLAQLYNDRSVLESFHCAAFSQILRRYWPTAFASTEMRKSTISSILATDMAVHFDYMKRMCILSEQVADGTTVNDWDVKRREDTRALLSALLIKCADISNVARHYKAAARWAIILTDEFSRQADMEKDVGIPSQLFAPPIQDSIIELGKSQLAFTKLFALPLFQGVTELLPEMRFTVDEIELNKNVWTQKIEEAAAVKTPTHGLVPLQRENTHPNGGLIDTEIVGGIQRGPALHSKSGNSSESQSQSGTHSKSNSRSALDPEVAQQFDFGFDRRSPADTPRTGSESTVMAGTTKKSNETNGRLSEHNSVPSHDRYSGATSTTNTPYSPSTNATSDMSLPESSGSVERPRTAPHLYPPPEPEARKSGGMSDTIKSLRQRPSRFKLNFWRSSKRKSPRAMSP